mgnify:CR=1 FL=1
MLNSIEKQQFTREKYETIISTWALHGWLTDEEVASSEKIIEVIDKVATLTEKTALNAQSVAAGAQEQASVVTEVAENTINLKQMATSLDQLVNQFRTRGEAHV